MPYRTDRNRKMLVEYEAGKTIEQLGSDYALSSGSVRALLIAEKHKRLHSPEQFYRALRDLNRPAKDDVSTQK